MARHLIPVDAIVVYVMHTHILVVLLWIFFLTNILFCVCMCVCVRATHVVIELVDSLTSRICI